MCSNIELDLAPLQRLIELTPNYGLNWSAPEPIPELTVSDGSREPSSSGDNDSRPPSRVSENMRTRGRPERSKHHPTYAAEKAMDNLVTAVQQWKLPSHDEPMKDPDDEAIDTLIHEHEGDPVERWHELTASMVKNNKNFDMDYIITTEPHMTADRLKGKNKVLIKWTGFAIPTWGKVDDVNSKRTKDDQVQVMKQRLGIMADLEAKIRADFDFDFDFEQAYPRRWLMTVEDFNEYVEDEHARYLNRQRAWEWRMNTETQRTFKEAAPLYVENWVDDVDVPTPKEMNFITTLRPSPKVATILANTNELGWVKCTQCKVTCTYPREHFKDKTNCCGVLYGSTNHYASKKFVSRCVDAEMVKADYCVPGLTSHEIEMSPLVECLESCGCNSDPTQGAKCTQMVVQRGRQFPLIVFREDPNKGWGVRAAVKIPKHEFVTEYVGEVVTAREWADRYTGSHYTFDMRFGWSENLTATDRVKNRRRGNVMRNHKAFSVDASKMGNEARYINHSCEPNLISVVVYVERHGEFYHRIAFFTRRDIEFGEELSIDYFPNASSEDIKNSKFMFEQCRCGTASCKFKNVVEEEQDDADCHSVDSFMSDDVEFEREKIAVEKRRNEMDEESERRRREKERRRSQRVEQLQVQADAAAAVSDTRKAKEDNSQFSTGQSISDLRRDPKELIKERCGGDNEKYEQVMAARMKSSLFAAFANDPFDAEEMRARLERSASKRLMQRVARLERERAADNIGAKQEPGTGRK